MYSDFCLPCLYLPGTFLVPIPKLLCILPTTLALCRSSARRLGAGTTRSSGQTPIYGENLTRHEAGRLAGQEQYDIGHLLRPA